MGSPSAQSRLMLLGARAKILAAHVELFRRVYMRGEVEGCIYPEACAQARCDMLNMHLRDLPSQKNPLIPWSEDTVQDPDEGAICDVCMDQLLADVAKQQREIWLALPSYFGLPEWSELKDSTVAAAE